MTVYHPMQAFTAPTTFFLFMCFADSQSALSTVQCRLCREEDQSPERRKILAESKEPEPQKPTPTKKTEKRKKVKLKGRDVGKAVVSRQVVQCLYEEEPSTKIPKLRVGHRAIGEVWPRIQRVFTTSCEDEMRKRNQPPRRWPHVR